MARNEPAGYEEEQKCANWIHVVTFVLRTGIVLDQGDDANKDKTWDGNWSLRSDLGNLGRSVQSDLVLVHQPKILEIIWSGCPLHWASSTCVACALNFAPEILPVLTVRLPEQKLRAMLTKISRVVSMAQCSLLRRTKLKPHKVGILSNLERLHWNKVPRLSKFTKLVSVASLHIAAWMSNLNSKSFHWK